MATLYRTLTFGTTGSGSGARVDVSPFNDADTLVVSFTAPSVDKEIRVSLAHSGGYPDARRIYVLRDAMSNIVHSSEQTALSLRLFVGKPSVRGCNPALDSGTDYELTVTSATPTQGRRIDCFLTPSWKA